MFKFYISSVIIYMIVIFCLAKICKPKLTKNGWKLSLDILLIFSAIPLLRLVAIGVILYLTTITQEEYEKTRGEHYDE